MASIAVAIRYASNLAELQNNIKQGINQIEALNDTAEKMAERLGGSKMIQAAHNLVAAIDKVGVSTLTASQASNELAKLERAMEKLEATGKPIPAAMTATADGLKKIVDSSKQAQPQIEQIDKKSHNYVGTLKEMAGALGLAFGASAIVGGIKTLLTNTLAYASSIEDMSKKLDISIGATQRYKYAADQTGASLEDVGKAVNKLSLNLAGGGDSVKEALGSAGLEFDKIRAMNPERAFEATIAAVARIPDPMKQARVAMELFGKSGVELLPAIREGFLDIAASATVMKDSTIERLARAEDAWQQFTNKVVIWTGELIGAAMQQSEMTDRQRERYIALVKNGGDYKAFLAQVAAENEAAAKATAEHTAQANMLSGSYMNAMRNLPPVVQAKKELTAEEKAAAAEVKRLAEAFQQQVDVLTGKALAREVAELSQQVAAAGKQGGLSAHEYARLGKELDAMREQGASLPNNLHKIWLEHERLNPSIKVTTDVSKSWATAMGTVKNPITALHKPVEMLQQDMARLIQNDPSAFLKNLGVATVGLSAPFSAALGRANELNDGIYKMRVEGASSAEVLDKYGDAAVQAAIDLVRMGGSLDMLNPRVRQLAEEMEAARRKMALADKIAEIGSVVSNVGGMIANEIGGRWGEAMGHATSAFGSGAASISSFMKGDIVGGIQAGVAALLSFGKALGAVFGNETKASREQFAQGMNLTLDELYKKLQSLGAQGEELANQALNVIGRHDEVGNRRWMDQVTAFLAQTEADIQRTADVLAKYGDVWEQLPAALQAKRIADEVKTLAEEHAILTANGYTTAQATAAQADAYNELLAKALKAGTEIPDAMLPVLLQMAELGQLTEANMRAMLGLKDESTVDFKAMEEAAKRYGIELGDLGPKFQQAKLNDLFKGLLSDFTLLSEGGANMAVVIAKMGPQVNDAVLQAIKFGAEIPAAMRPMIEAMANAGQLVDENGDKLTDLGGLKWATPIEESMKELVKLFKELITQMMGARDAANLIPPRVTVDVEFRAGKFPGLTGRVDTDVETAHSGALVTAAGIRRFHSGTARVLPFPGLGGDEVPAILQTGEAVLRREAVSALGTEAVEALNGLSGGRRAGAGGQGSGQVVDLSAVLAELRAGRAAQARRDADMTQAMARSVRDEVQKVVNR